MLEPYTVKVVRAVLRGGKGREALTYPALLNKMKACAFCKEEINEEAIKCRYCGSTVGGDNLETGSQNRYVTYILDKDLVRFVKVASAFLAIFLLVGAFLYGFDLKQAAKEIRDAQKEALESNRKMKETEQAVSKMKAHGLSWVLTL